MAGNNIGGPKIVIPKPDNNGVASYVYHLQVGQTDKHNSMRITNAGEPLNDWNSLISYSAEAQGWLTLDPGSGTFPNHVPMVDVGVQVDTAGLQPGTQYTATVNLHWYNGSGTNGQPGGTLVVKLITV